MLLPEKGMQDNEFKYGHIEFSVSELHWPQLRIMWMTVTNSICRVSCSHVWPSALLSICIHNSLHERGIVFIPTVKIRKLHQNGRLHCWLGIAQRSWPRHLIQKYTSLPIVYHRLWTSSFRGWLVWTQRCSERWHSWDRPCKVKWVLFERNCFGGVRTSLLKMQGWHKVWLGGKVW